MNITGLSEVVEASDCLICTQDFLKLLNIFLEFLQVLESIQSFRIFFQAFINTPGLLEVAKHFSRISRSHTKSQKLQNIIPSIYNHSSTS